MEIHYLLLFVETKVKELGNYRFNSKIKYNNILNDIFYINKRNRRFFLYIISMLPRSECFIVKFARCK